jgi:hypothetical protein
MAGDFCLLGKGQEWAGKQKEDEKSRNTHEKGICPLSGKGNIPFCNVIVGRKIG